MSFFKRFKAEKPDARIPQIVFEKIPPCNLSDYVIFDLETTGFSLDAEIIEFGAIKICQNQIIDRFDMLVKPVQKIPSAISKINHITNEMVSSSPKIDAALPHFLSFISNNTLVGYNISTYDIPIIKRLLNIYASGDLFFDYFDVLDLARNKLSHLPDKRLGTVAPYLGIVPENSHRATSDCITTKLCFDKLSCFSDSDAVNKSVPSSSYRGYAILSDSTNSLRELQMLLSGIIADNIVTEEEVLNLYSWLKENDSLKGQFPYDRVLDAVVKVLEDGVVTSQESEELRSLFEIFIDPVKSEKTVSECIICSKNFVLTGDFEYGDKSKVEEMITNAGGIIKSGVSKKVDYVAVGTLGSPQWCNGNYGTKIKRALELQAEGVPIQIITEKQLLDALEN